MNDLPIQKIQPEAEVVIEAYLANNRDVDAVAAQLGTTVTVITEMLGKREVRSYLDHLFMESGFRNRERLFGVMDNLIENKISELDEAQMGSNMDIMDMLKIYHGMKMKELELSIKLQELQNSGKQSAGTINNVQINNSSGYDQLLNRIIAGGKK